MLFGSHNLGDVLVKLLVNIILNRVRLISGFRQFLVSDLVPCGLGAVPAEINDVVNEKPSRKEFLTYYQKTLLG